MKQEVAITSKPHSRTSITIHHNLIAKKAQYMNAIWSQSAVSSGQVYVSINKDGWHVTTSLYCTAINNDFPGITAAGYLQRFDIYIDMKRLFFFFFSFDKSCTELRLVCEAVCGCSGHRSEDGSKGHDFDWTCQIIVLSNMCLCVCFMCVHVFQFRASVFSQAKIKAKTFTQAAICKRVHLTRAWSPSRSRSPV